MRFCSQVWQSGRPWYTPQFAAAILVFIGLGSGAERPGESNLNDCLQGSSRCDVARLTPTDIAEVSKAFKKRNFANCQQGLTSCDPTVLNTAEAGTVQQALRQ